MRSKEEAHDYRYFPEPDLLPLELEAAWVEGLRAALPELPDAKKRRFVSDYGLSAYDADVLVAEHDTADYFEAAAKGRDAKLAANWIIGDLFAQLNKNGLAIARSPVGAAQLGGLLDLIADGTISGRIAKDVFEVMFETGRDAAAIVEEKGLRQVSDAGAIEAIVAKVIADNPDKVAAYRGGKATLAGWFVGQVMKATGGKANPALANQVVTKQLSE
jgi:aspartyl-tRNA(Asn)/glutamyl-tRNA(Gln) amidotransferase subunit B